MRTLLQCKLPRCLSWFIQLLEGVSRSVEEGCSCNGQGKHASKAHGAIVLVAGPDAEPAAVLIDDIDAVGGVQEAAANAHFRGCHTARCPPHLLGLREPRVLRLLQVPYSR